MILTFNPDGTTVGFNDNETKNFLAKIGDTVFSENADMTRFQLSKNVVVFGIYDQSGHKCPLCCEKKHALVEVINEACLKNPKMFRACYDCLQAMYSTRLYLGMS